MTERLTSFTRDGFTFDVIDEGPLDGDPVVLLHGFPQRASSWSAVTGLLHGAGLRTYAPDQRGYSLGARPRRRRDYRVAELVGDVVALLESIGRPVHLVGHDWGAMVAWAVAARHPDRVRSLSVMSVGHPSAFLGSMARGQVLKSWYMAVFQVPGLAERALGSPRSAGRALAGFGMDEQMARAFGRDMVDAGALRGGLMWYRALPWTLREPRDRVHVPTTMIWSTDDAALGRRQAVRSEAYVDAPFGYVELPGVSHWIPDHAPQAAAEAVLARVRSV